MASQTLFSLIPLLLTAAGLVTILWLFVQLKMEIARLAGASRRPEQTKIEKNVELLSTRVDQLAARVGERSALLPPNPLVTISGLNLSKRTNVLRLSRRGDAPDHIAATLHLPRREVELLLKIHDLSFKAAPSTRPETIQ